MSDIYLMQCFDAKHDTNGNPRRVYVFSVCVDAGGPDGYVHKQMTVDDGYRGRLNALAEFRKVYGNVLVCDMGSARCTATEYRELVKWKLGSIRHTS